MKFLEEYEDKVFPARRQQSQLTATKCKQAHDESIGQYATRFNRAADNAGWSEDMRVIKKGFGRVGGCTVRVRVRIGLGIEFLSKNG